MRGRKTSRKIKIGNEEKENSGEIHVEKDSLILNDSTLGENRLTEVQNFEDQTHVFEQNIDLTEIGKSLGERNGGGVSFILIDSTPVENRSPQGQNAEDQTDAFEQVGDLTEIEKSLGEIHGEGDSLVLIDSFSIENRLPPTRNFTGSKRPLEPNMDLTEVEESSGTSSVAYDSTYIKLKKQCIRLENRVKELESEWMPRPQHQEVIQYFFDTVKLLDGPEPAVARNKHEHIMQLAETLGIDEIGLSKLNKKTATATARAVIRYKYQNPPLYFSLADVDKSFIDAIITYVKYSNPFDTASYTTLRKAMANCFSSLTFKRKVKSSSTFNKRVEEEQQE